MAAPKSLHRLSEEMLGLTKAGIASNEIARRLGVNAGTVRKTVRKLLPNAFRLMPEIAATKDTAVRTMPHNSGYSTGLPSAHSISLPRLQCLEAAA